MALVSETHEPWCGMAGARRHADVGPHEWVHGDPEEPVEGVELDPVGWKIVLEVIVKTNARFLEIPIVFAERRSGTSKLNIKTQMEYLHHLWKLYRYTHKSRGRFPASCYAILSFAVASLVVAGVIQFGFATVPSDADTAYHAAVASSSVITEFSNRSRGRR